MEKAGGPASGGCVARAQPEIHGGNRGASHPSKRSSARSMTPNRRRGRRTLSSDRTLRTGRSHLSEAAFSAPASSISPCWELGNRFNRRKMSRFQMLDLIKGTFFISLAAPLLRGLRAFILYIEAFFVFCFVCKAIWRKEERGEKRKGVDRERRAGERGLPASR